MSFNDDRLRELKKDLARFGNIDVCNFFEDNGDIERLVTRLDAAEKLIDACGQDIDVSKPYKAWLRAAGRVQE